MDILRKNTDPVLTIIPRQEIADNLVIKFRFENEFSQAKLVVLSDTVTKLPNGLLSVLLEEIPEDVNIGDKFSYTAVDNDTDEVICLGKAIMLGETESVQDYSKADNNKFYK